MNKKANQKLGARRRLINITKRASIQALRIAPVKEGMQYVSDGAFVARYNYISEDEGGTFSENYPFEFLDKNIFESSDVSSEECLELKADDVRFLRSGKGSDFSKKIARMGKNYYDLFLFRMIYSTIINPQVFLKKSGKTTPVYLKGDNAEAILLPLRVEKEIVSDSLALELDYVEVLSDE